MSARFEERPVGVWDRQAKVLVLPHTPEWADYQAHIAANGEPDPRAPEPALELAAALAEKLALVDNLAGDIRRKVTGGRAHPAEMAMWPAKIAEAREYLAAPGSPPTPPMLRVEANARGITVDALAERVMNNANAHALAEAFIAGVAGKHKDALRALATVEDVLAYDIDAGWGEFSA